MKGEENCRSRDSRALPRHFFFLLPPFPRSAPVIPAKAGIHAAREVGLHFVRIRIYGDIGFFRILRALVRIRLGWISRYGEKRNLGES